MSKYPKEIYNAYDHYHGSHLSRNFIDSEPNNNVRLTASMALPWGTTEFDNLMEAHHVSGKDIPEKARPTHAKMEGGAGRVYFYRVTQEKLLLRTFVRPSVNKVKHLVMNGWKTGGGLAVSEIIKEGNYVVDIEASCVGNKVVFVEAPL